VEVLEVVNTQNAKSISLQCKQKSANDQAPTIAASSQLPQYVQYFDEQFEVDYPPPPLDYRAELVLATKMILLRVHQFG
jgi:hypothetical protein